MTGNDSVHLSVNKITQKDPVSKWPYEDIVNLPHHVSTKHAAMPLKKRAAQFAPFAALTGYDDAVEETVRRVMAEGEKQENGQDQM